MGISLRLTSISMLLLLVNIGCNMGPKSTVVELPKKNLLKAEIDQSLHEVVVAEVLAADNYLYLKVREENREFWISTTAQAVEKGGTYLYKEALLKTKFKSKEHERVFDTLYMVTTLIPKKHGLVDTKTGRSEKEAQGEKSDIPERSEVSFGGAIKISELVANPKKYQGKIVELRGKCTKINPGILNRNWIHLKDGSQDDFDLVITSEEEVKEGGLITIRGIVQLNQDFGSGYFYDILLERGTVVH